tara:strand:+ start:187 stop:330 length:144 start_codon:yes stop_codon:yes gene_type:complete
MQARGRRRAARGFLADFCGFLTRYRNPRKLTGGQRLPGKKPVKSEKS